MATLVYARSSLLLALCLLTSFLPLFTFCPAASATRRTLGAPASGPARTTTTRSARGTARCARPATPCSCSAPPRSARRTSPTSSCPAATSARTTRSQVSFTYVRIELSLGKIAAAIMLLPAQIHANKEEMTSKKMASLTFAALIPSPSFAEQQGEVGNEALHCRLATSIALGAYVCTSTCGSFSIRHRPSVLVRPPTAWAR